MTGTAAGRAGPVLVLDFDGVVCDGFAECALVTWNGHFGRPLADFGPDGLATIPPAFLTRFRQTRGWARHLGHFLVPLLAGSDRLADQAAFEAVFAGVPGPVVAGFTETVNRYRAAARTAYPERWRAYHRLYDGVVDVLAAAGEHWYVVTAKDTASVLEILAAVGVHLPGDRVYGEQTSKVAALGDIARRESVPAGDVTFVDDSLPNVVAARHDGFAAVWATWGFHGDDHVTLARQLEVPSLGLRELAAGGFADRHRFAAAQEQPAGAAR